METTSYIFDQRPVWRDVSPEIDLTTPRPYYQQPSLSTIVSNVLTFFVCQSAVATTVRLHRDGPFTTRKKEEKSNKKKTPTHTRSRMCNPINTHGGQRPDQVIGTRFQRVSCRLQQRHQQQPVKPREMGDVARRVM